MEITVLAENTAVSDSIGSEHGLSLYIKANGKNILFDMGQTDLFAKNAQKLGIDLSDVDIAVLSHGHYDHGGGLACFLTINKKAPIYVNEHAFEPHYNGTSKYIGLDRSLCSHERIVFTSSKHSICQNITLYPAVCDITGRFTSAGLTRYHDGEYIPEDFCHEQYLEIIENNKKYLFSGCSHRGITNIVNAFTPDILIGGFHLSKHPLDDDLTAYAEYLDSFGTEYYTCHCTGEAQFEFLKRRMKKLHYIGSGERI